MNFDKSTLTSRQILVTVITLETKVVVVVHVHCICVIQKEFDATVLTNFLFTGFWGKKGGGDGVCHAHVFPHVIG